jgi:hypothetical protein
MSMKDLEQTLTTIREDIELRPFFVDFVCKGFALGLTDSFRVGDTERMRFQKDYYQALYELSSRVEKKVHVNETLPVINEVCHFYLQQIGRIGFETYAPNK